jgi:hypothetical protein
MIAAAKRRSTCHLGGIFLVVFAAQFPFGMWLNARGFQSSDSLYRSVNALQVLHGSDPHLGAIGLVWMPLPTLLQLPWTAVFPLWPDVVSSGASASLTTSLAGGATAALLLATCTRLGLSARLGWAYAVLVSANPMLFLYSANGLSEGVAAPFLIGAVCCLTLFWHSGLRRYVVVAGVALALGFASLYEAVPFGAALFAALVGGVIWDSEARPSAPQGRWRALEGLGLVLLVPSFFVAALWLLANAVIMRDPLFFAFSPYSNHAQTKDAEGFVFDLAGDALGTLAFVCERSAPFLIPIGFVLLVRVLDGRFLRVNTVSALLLSASVPFGLIAPLVYGHASFGWLRFFVYVLFVAAGWGLYEVATSRRPRRAASLVMAGWALAFPATLLAMSNPAVGQEEHVVVKALVRGEGAQEVGHNNPLIYMRPVARYLEAGPLARGQRVLFDGAWPLLALARPSHLRTVLIQSSDRRFRAMLKDPRGHRVSYLLVQRPGTTSDALARARPRLWAGEEPGFRLVKSFSATPEHWRLYETERVPTRTTAARPPRGD